MYSKTLALSCVVVVAMLACLPQAHSIPAKYNSNGYVDSIMEAADINGDMKLSFKEVTTFYTDRGIDISKLPGELLAMDKNQDGFIEPVEIDSDYDRTISKYYKN